MESKMKIYLQKAIFINRAPFDKIEFDFNENEIGVLSAINGRGKTTVLSHVADAFYEMVKNYYSDTTDDSTRLYRVSNALFNIDSNLPSFVYLRFKIDDGYLDYVDVRNKCTQSQYDAAITLSGKIEYSIIDSVVSIHGFTKVFSSNFSKDLVEKIFKNNINIYFPAYRYEIPGYLNEPHKVKLNFRKHSHFSGNLNKPIEVISNINEIANWIMDVVIDQRGSGSSSPLFNGLNQLITQTISSKGFGNVRFGIGTRDFGAGRIQIVTDPNVTLVYPSIFNLSSGEFSLLCLFSEILRQADINKINVALEDITGIVVIDEVDKHLHVKMQKEILPKLFNLFPNIQFIVTSHSPFLSLGLAEQCSARTKVLDLNTGCSIDPIADQQYLEVYEMMIADNDRYKHLLEKISSEIEVVKELQIITEGKNTEHILKALSLVAHEVLPKIKVIAGVENKSGQQQLKNAFEIMSKSNYANKFLMIWDCDSEGIVNSLIETSHCYKFVFPLNNENIIAKKGIENLYCRTLFTDDVYDVREIPTDYGGSKIEKSFNKNKFFEKINLLDNADIFANYGTLITKIKSLLSNE